MMKPITLDYQGLSIHATREAWFNATEIAEYHGKRLDKFFERRRNQDYIRAIAAKHGFLNTPKTGDLKTPFNPADCPELIQTKRGRHNGGTWLHPDLMVCFARFISLEFEIWADQTIKALLIDGKDWKPSREEAATGHRLMCEAIYEAEAAAGNVPGRFTYINESCRINRALTGKWAKLNRDGLSAAQLKMIKQLEIKNAALYMAGKSADERDLVLNRMAAPHRAAFQTALTAGTA
ncbi:KilA-N domain-containing protein [Neisseria zoodegmatis]|uniref:Phage related protein n=2 Tax=Neisseria zoodegmatis TaxID=326523 RepID=A0AB38DQS2_9NEIS|nr:KilA-N domain-containing protein [Neisseria zoodegmatis]SNU79535.1 putative phage related protein [Neisseria zoodegmatis]